MCAYAYFHTNARKLEKTLPNAKKLPNLLYMLAAGAIIRLDIILRMMPERTSGEQTLNLDTANSEQLQQWRNELEATYANICKKNLNLDLTRGKPSTEQLSLSDSLDNILHGNYITPSGVDTRNYGGLEGIAEARELGGKLLGVPESNVFAGGNSSLTLMYQTASVAYHYGLAGEGSAWKEEDSVKFLCPVPGYDRHFSVCERLGIEMITVPMTSSGPDMDAVEKAISEDHSIKGLWCVPKYSNPTGVIYSDATVTRIAQLGKIAGKNFRVFWDNAYAVHDLSDEPQKLANIYQACSAAGTEDSVIQFASTSKITHAGAGISFIAASDVNLKHYKHAQSFTTIGPDKVNQLRHALFFKEDSAITEHMKKHAAIIKPRFACVLSHLQEAFGNNNVGAWESAEGGYFISFDTMPGLAKIVVKLAADAGVKLTPAGATFPYGLDPEDRNIRIAPTVPTEAQVDEAMKVFVTCVNLASVRHALKNI